MIDRKLSKDDKNYVNVKKKFKEKAPSVIEQMQMKKLEAEMR